MCCGSLLFLYERYRLVQMICLCEAGRRLRRPSLSLRKVNPLVLKLSLHRRSSLIFHALLGPVKDPERSVLQRGRPIPQLQPDLSQVQPRRSCDLFGLLLSQMAVFTAMVHCYLWLDHRDSWLYFCLRPCGEYLGGEKNSPFIQWWLGGVGWDGGREAVEQ